jgi:hypothetical protein
MEVLMKGMMPNLVFFGLVESTKLTVAFSVGINTMGNAHTYNHHRDQ